MVSPRSITDGCTDSNPLPREAVGRVDEALGEYEMRAGVGEHPGCSRCSRPLTCPRSALASARAPSPTRGEGSKARRIRATPQKHRASVPASPPSCRAAWPARPRVARGMMTVSIVPLISPAAPSASRDAQILVDGGPMYTHRHDLVIGPLRRRCALSSADTNPAESRSCGRPMSVTTSSLAVNSTARGFRSPTSSSKVLIPSAQQKITILPQMANDIADFMGREPGVDRNRHIVKPEFGFVACCSRNVNVRGFFALIRIKEGAIGSPAQNRRHVNPSPALVRLSPPLGHPLPQGERGQEQRASALHRQIIVLAARHLHRLAAQHGQARGRCAGASRAA